MSAKVDVESVDDLLVVGAGFAGLYAVHRAREAGLRVRGIEAGSDVGGTWFWNRYPGARCDVESVDYSYSFDEDLQREWVWTERFAAQPEILAYINHVADRFALRESFRFDQRVTSARFDEAASVWEVRTDAGEVSRARFVVMATGCLSAVNKPDIPGIDDFAGEVIFTAMWPEDEPDFSGKRVGVIGTGSSGIQSIPIIAKQAASLTVFQRSPNYSVPAANRPFEPEEWRRIQEAYPARRAKSSYASAATPHEAHPQRAVDLDESERLDALEERWQQGGVLFGKTFPDQNADLVANGYAREFAERKIREIVKDEQTATDLIPTDHPIGTKRICTDDGYFETYNLPNVELVNLRRDPITEVTDDGIITAARSYELDTLVFATGFDALTGALMRLDLQGARGTTIQEVWGDGPVTYLGMAIPGFPNMFNLSGPGSPSVLANMVMHAEQQVEWVIDLVLWSRDNEVAQVEPRHDAAEKWTEHLVTVADQTLFPLAPSWYVGGNIEGKKRVFMPYIGGFGAYRQACDQVQESGYDGFAVSRA